MLNWGGSFRGGVHALMRPNRGKDRDCKTGKITDLYLGGKTKGGEYRKNGDFCFAWEKLVLREREKVLSFHPAEKEKWGRKLSRS